MNKTTPSQSDYCRLKVAHHLRENLVLSLVAVSVVSCFDISRVAKRNVSTGVNPL